MQEVTDAVLLAAVIDEFVGREREAAVGSDGMTVSDPLADHVMR